MPGGALVDVAIGLVLMFLLLSLLVTTLQEAIASLLKLRASNLYRGVAHLLRNGDPVDPSARAGGKSLVEELYASSTIRPLHGNRARRVGKGSRPSYIPSNEFAAGLLETLAKGTALEGQALDQLFARADEIVGGLPASHPLKTPLTLLLGDLGRAVPGTAERAAVARARIEGWFNTTMERVAGWYQRKAQLWTFGLGLATAVLLNADALYVAQHLARAGDLERRALLDRAESGLEGLREAVDGASTAPPPEHAPADVDEARDDLRAALARTRQDLDLAGLPLGWSGAARLLPGQNRWAAPVGWLVTALAVGLGAKFWFGILKDLLKLRGTGTRVSSTTGRTERARD